MKQNRQILQSTEGYKFTAQNDTYSHFLLCKICTKLMIEPSRLYPCGHTFCKSCILQFNKNISSARQNKCFIPFPQCGKYYINLQPDLLAASLINDLQVKCLSKQCPWTGPLERFKISHQNLCQLKEGGLNSWLSDFNEGVKSIKKIRNQRKNNNCIDIDDIDDDQIEILKQNPNQEQKSIQNLTSPLDDFKQQRNQFCFSNNFEVNEISVLKDKATVLQKKPLLGLNKSKVGDQKKKQKNILPQIIVDIEDDSLLTGVTLSVLNKQLKEIPINLDENIDAKHLSDQKPNDQNRSLQNQKINGTKADKGIKQNYTGLKMINSYKNKSHKIAQNPHNMNLTRCQPQIRDQDEYLK